MAGLVEARDPYTGGHLWRVSQCASLLGGRLGLSPGEIFRLRLAGFLHDLGKVAVPDAVLGKTGRLTAEEFEVVRTHPMVGVRLVRGTRWARWPWT